MSGSIIISDDENFDGDKASDLLRGDPQCDCPQVNLLVGLYAGKYKENTWTDSSHYSSISKLDYKLELSLTQTYPLKDFQTIPILKQSQ